MFRLVKLAAYALIGYMLYEFFNGLMQGSKQRGGGREAQRSREIPNTPTPQGRVVNTADSDGSGARHVVGRGVVRR